MSLSQALILISLFNKEVLTNHKDTFQQTVLYLLRLETIDLFMKLLRHSFLIVTLLLFGVHTGFSQVDDKKKESIAIKAKIIKPIKKTNSFDKDIKNGFKNAYNNSKKVKTKAQIDAELKNKGIITQKMLNKQRFEKNMEKYNLKIPMTDKDFGSFHTKSKNINISSYDYGLQDGDVVTISKNGKIMIDSYTLTNGVRNFKIPLDIGFNRIEILAINEGSLRPNTGAFKVFDDFNKTIINDLWALAKGAKVIALIIRDK